MTMDSKRDHTVATAVELIRKFGFLPRSIVWKYLSPKGTTSKYYYWHLLSHAPQFSTYRNGFVSSNHLVLSAECRKLLGDGAYVGTRSATYFEHDELLMDFVMQLKGIDLAPDYRTEQELRKDRLGALKMLGGDPDDKIPDVVFDLPALRGPIRVALEVERTRKSQERYRRIHFGYRRLKRLDLILFGVGDNATEAAIRREFDRISLSSEAMPYGCFSLAQFSTQGLACELRIQEKTLVLGGLLSSVCGRQFSPENAKSENDPENRRNSFQAKVAAGGDLK